jgi:DNA-binding MarR family transcriptional regulator
MHEARHGHRVGGSLRRAQQALRSALDTALRREGLTSPQYAVLEAISAEPGLSGAELARRSFVTAQTMNDIVAGLEAAALAVRTPHPQGGRRLEVAPTALGRRTLQRCQAVVEQVESRLVDGMDEDEVAMLLATLGRCVRNLDRSI